jgi:hypothetical protein
MAAGALICLAIALSGAGARPPAASRALTHR